MLVKFQEYISKLRNTDVKEVVSESKRIKEETSLNTINLGIETIASWRAIALKSINLNIFLSFAIIIAVAGYHLVFPLHKINYLTVGYKVENSQVKVVDVTPANELSTPQLKLLAKFFIEDTVQKALTNYRNDKLLLNSLKIVSSRVTPEVMNQIKELQKQFEAEHTILSRQIVILDSNDDGYGSWKLRFKTVDEDIRGNIFENKFEAKVVFDILGFGSAEHMNLPVELVKENPNPLGLQIKGFYRIQEDKGDN